MFPVALVAVLLSTGCGDDGGEHLKSIESGARALVEELQLPKGISESDLHELKLGLNEAAEKLRKHDFAAFREKATDLDTYLSVRIFRWYGEVFEAYDATGSDAALARISELRTTPDIEQHESDALDDMAAELNKGDAMYRDDLYFTVFFHSLRPRYGDAGALLIVSAIAGAQLATRLG